MKGSFLIVIIALFMCSPVIANDVVASYAPFKFEKALGPETFQASGKKIKLWGLRGPDKDLPQYMATVWFLEELIKGDDLTCRLMDVGLDNLQIMHCLVGKNDVGSMIVQMGLASADGKYYEYEEQIARSKRRGLWGNPEDRRL